MWRLSCVTCSENDARWNDDVPKICQVGYALVQQVAQMSQGVSNVVSDCDLNTHATGRKVVKSVARTDNPAFVLNYKTFGSHGSASMQS